MVPRPSPTARSADAAAAAPYGASMPMRPVAELAGMAGTGEDEDSDAAAARGDGSAPRAGPPHRRRCSERAAV
ncbi:hypothetical protein GUJ93_ZPchr0006g43091 [Zizania palustris]|uniref:Uncharacterized protein n=1 Tax=Zizania palustris TaxID=103762 RepID=A0A8J5TBA5_ZIZPA|nr:hypothetical protein GUJ93_ZPchr0006g43091 [Zizania palustris]